MKRRLIINSILLLMLAWIPLLPGQSLSLSFHRLGLVEGLSQTTSRTLFRDARGFMWIGTNGLNRFDGTRVKYYGNSSKDTTSLADPVVTGNLLAASNDNFWVGTHTALHRYQRQRDCFERFTAKNTATDYFPLAVHSDGSVLVRADTSLYRFDPDNQKNGFKKIGTLGGSESVFFSVDSTSSEGYIITYSFRVQAGLKIQYLKQGMLKEVATFLDGHAGQSAAYVHCVWMDANQLLWAGTNSGLFKVDIATKNCDHLLLLSASTPFSVNDILPLDNQYLFLGSSLGLLLYDKFSGAITKYWEHQKEYPYSLMGNAIFKLYLDREENLWVSIWGKGINYANLKKSRFECFRFLTGAAATEKRPFMPGQMVESNGRIWLGSPMQGLFSIYTNGGGFRDHHHLMNRVDQLLALDAQTLLATDLSGFVFLVKPLQKIAQKIVYQGKPLVSGYLCRLYETCFLMASPNIPGLFCLYWQNDKLSIVPVTGDLPPSPFYFLQKGQGNSIFCVDVQDRLYTFELQDQKATALRLLQTLHGYAYGALTTKSHTWIGGGFGLLSIRHQDRKIVAFDKTSGLPDEVVYALTDDEKGQIWLTCNKGIAQYDTALHVFHAFDLSDGLQGMEFNRTSILKTPDGTIWTGGVEGINRFYPPAVHFLKILPQIQLVGINVNDAPYQTRKNIGEISDFSFSYDSATLSFSFAALEFSNPLNNKLHYQLFYADGLPFDADSVLCPDARGFARYAKLPPGQYRLRIKAANSDGIWNLTAKEINLTIRPPFWQTTGFRLFVIGLLLGLIYAAYRYRLAQVQRAAALQLDMAEAEMKALRAQLNPHFIFNNLNTVRAFLLRKDIAGANAYLGSFARLMRAILESSLHHTIRLEEELDLLREYVATESKHLAHPLHYVENIAPDIDPYEIQVPGMLLQPFVENAIVHGLRPKQQPGTITISATQTGTHLMLHVEDDGVGRSAEKTPLPEKKHTSRALQIIHDRLRYYDMRHQTQSSIHFIDLYDAQGVPSGVRVEIWLGLSSLRKKPLI